MYEIDVHNELRENYHSTNLFLFLFCTLNVDIYLMAIACIHPRSAIHSFVHWIQKWIFPHLFWFLAPYRRQHSSGWWSSLFSCTVGELYMRRLATVSRTPSHYRQPLTNTNECSVAIKFAIREIILLFNPEIVILLARVWSLQWILLLLIPMLLLHLLLSMRIVTAIISLHWLAQYNVSLGRTKERAVIEGTCLAKCCDIINWFLSCFQEIILTSILIITTTPSGLSIMVSIRGFLLFPHTAKNNQLFIKSLNGMSNNSWEIVSSICWH